MLQLSLTLLSPSEVDIEHLGLLTQYGVFCSCWMRHNRVQKGLQSVLSSSFLLSSRVDGAEKGLHNILNGVVLPSNSVSNFSSCSFLLQGLFLAVTVADDSPVFFFA